MNIFKIATLSLLVISFASCKRDYADSPGKAPTNISAKDGFTCGTFTASNDADIPLAVYPSFDATFPEMVSWKIELIGQTSTATKTLSGTSKVINASNSTWIGNHDGLYFFETGETVTANLIISGKPGVCASTTFTIAATRNEVTTTPTFMLMNPHSHYEITSVTNTNKFPAQFSIGATTIETLQNQVIRAPQGQYYMHIEGVSVAANGFFVGGLQSRSATSSNMLPATWTDPSKIYLNIYVRGIDNLPLGNFPYAILNFECQEDDNNNISNSTNCVSPGVTDKFCPATEDSWVFKIPVRHTGWQLFSCKYSDLLPSEDFANGGFGNRKLEPQKVCRMQLGMISSPPFNRVSVDVDYACLTYGAPYDPKK